MEPPAPVFNLSKADKEREGVGVVQRVVVAAGDLQGEVGLWIPKGRTGEAGFGWFSSKTFFSDTLI